MEEKRVYTMCNSLTPPSSAGAWKAASIVSAISCAVSTVGASDSPTQLPATGRWRKVK